MKSIIEELRRASRLLVAFRHAIQDCAGTPRSHCFRCLNFFLNFNAEYEQD